MQPKFRKQPHLNTLARTLFRPEVLFGASVAGCFVTYLQWVFYGKTVSYDFNPNSTALVIWAVGFLSVCFGSAVGRVMYGMSTKGAALDSFTMRPWILPLWLAACVVQLMLAIHVYQGIPLLGYLSGRVTVMDVNDLQGSARFGQLGVFSISITCSMFFCALAMVAKFLQRRAGLWERLAFVFLLFCSSIAGKRQGAVMGVIILMCVAALRGCSLRQFGAWVVGFSYSKRVGMFGIAALILLLFVFTQSLDKIRVNEFRISFAPTAYFELPQINFHYQTEIAGYGPFEHYEVRAILGTLAPRRMWNDYFAQYVLPSRLELTSPAGFWEYLQWFVGLPGVIVFAVLCGLVASWAMESSRSSAFALGAYSLMAWAFLSAAAYNHFLNAIFVLWPALAIGGTLALNKYVPRFREGRVRPSVGSAGR